MPKPIGNPGPPCDCHGEPKVWNSAPAKKSGGYWICRVRARDRSRARSRARGATPFGSAEHHARLTARFRGKKHPPGCGHCARASGPGSWNWHGDSVTYPGSHQRHRKAIAGLPCAHADESCKGPIHAALRHETPVSRLLVDLKTRIVYTPDSEDYMPLCASHHQRYDVFFVWPFADRDRDVA